MVAAIDAAAPVSALTSAIESDWTSVYYFDTPLLLGNDGSAATGGWLAWNLHSATPLTNAHAETPECSNAKNEPRDVGLEEPVSNPCGSGQ
ncbi:hypothetical protein VTK56DRAFT_3176 [Thermocarpiscus australiensis]